MNDEHMRILVVDDHPKNLDILSELLEDQKFDVLFARDGMTGLQFAESGRPDLILLDIMMPGMDGIEVCRRLKANEKTKEIPVIFITALSELEEKVKGFACGAVDYITKPIQAEEVLARVKTHLALRHLQKTLQEQNEQLCREIEERKRAEEEVRRLNAGLETVNKELKSFAYTVSHDLKAPLRGISQLTHWFARDYAGVIDDDGQKMLTLLRNSVKGMAKLIDGILQYSRAGHPGSEKEDIDLNLLIRYIIESLMPPEHIQITIETDLPTVAGDETCLKQIFLNLLSNALKFMDKAEGSIRIGHVDEGDRWTFSVADNGPGIDPKYHEKIFRIFQSLDPHNTRENSGIGLATVKKHVERYGGRIWVDSAPGQGSTFSFTFPKREDEFEHV